MARSLTVLRRLTCAMALGTAGYASRAAADVEPTAPETSAAVPAATAQTETAPAPAAASPAPEAAEVPAAAAGDLPQDAEELYHLAFTALADADAALARSLLERLRASHPAHPLAQRAAELLALLPEPHAPTAAGAAPTSSEPQREERSEERRARSTTGIARAELVFAQTLHGIALGAEVCLMAECDGAQPWSALLMLGAGAGFATSFLASDGGVEPGLSRVLTDGVLWGAANGFMVMFATGALDDAVDEGPVIGAHLAGGQLLGLGIAGGLYALLEPSAGQVSLASSGGLWTLAATAQLAGAFDPDFDDQEWGWLLLGASDVGLIAGGLLAAHQPMGTSRVLMIDAGGLLGGLTGIGVAVLAQGEPEVGPTFGGGFAGTLLGLALAYHFTGDWDDDGAEHTRLTLMPLRDGLALGVHGQL